MNEDNNQYPISEDGQPTRIVGRNDANPYHVVLPCDVKDFRSFVSGLLGKPQELRGELEGSFKLTPRDVANVYHLLEQRMAKQNDATLVHFSVAVFYDDGNSVVHNNIHDFETYHPTTKCTPTGVVVSATYLIKFRGHEIPEKQEIEVIFGAAPEFRREAPRWFHEGLYQFRIVHTERTWATDIAGLLTNHGSTLINKASGAYKLVRRYADDIAIYFAQFIFLLTVFLWASLALKNLDALTGELQSIKDFIAFGIRSVPALALVIMAVVAIKFYVENTAFFIRQSSIVFTEADRDTFEKMESRRRRGVLRYVAVQLVSIATGIISNMIYSRNWSW